MSIQPAAEPALELEHVECSVLSDERVMLRLQGRRHGRRRGSDGRAILTVEIDGRHHRFPAIPQPRLARITRPGVWAASFALPSWLRFGLEGHTTLAIGELTIPVVGIPAPEASADLADRLESAQDRLQSAQASKVDGDGQDNFTPQGSEGEEDTSATRDLGHQDDADGPQTEALRAELKERATAEARVRGELADVRAELEARIANQTRLAAMHAELRSELERLREAVAQEDRQRAEVESRAVVLAAELADAQHQAAETAAERDQLKLHCDELTAEREALGEEIAELRAAVAAGIVSTDAASAEAAGLREELARLGAELAAAREQVGVHEAGVDEAEALLAEARALTASMREE